MSKLYVNCGLQKNIIMTKLLNFIATIILISLASCAGSDKNDYIDKSILPEGKQTTATGQPVLNTDTSLPTTVTNNNLNSVVATPTQGVNTITLPAPQQQQASALNRNSQNNMAASQPMVAQNAGNVQLNPAHGQPGHRCDISVGAPLNSPAGSSVPQPKIVTTQQPAAQQVATGMNPAHGQPGHRCDIAVGAPLNSKPVPTAPVAIPATTVPPLVTPVAAAADTGKG